MGVSIIKREYKSQFGNSNSVPPDWLLGNVGDWLKGKFLIEAGVDFLASDGEPIQINTEEKTLTIGSGKKWSDFGFDIGDTVTMQYIKATTDLITNTTTADPVEINFEIVQLYNSVLVYDEAAELAELGVNSIPAERGALRIYSVKLFCDKEIQGIVAKYNLLPNSQSANNQLASFIDTMTTEATYNGLQSLGSAQANMVLLPKQSGMAIESMKIKNILSQQSDDGASFALPDAEIYMDYFAAVYNKAAETFPLIILNVNPPYKTVGNIEVPINTTALGQYTNGIQSMMFLDNADFSGTRYLDLSLVFYFISKANSGADNTMKLILLKYNGGASYDFVSKTELQTWPITNASIGVNYNYSNVVPFTVAEGDSYALAFEFTSNGTSLVTRKLRYQIETGSLNILTGLTETSYKKLYEVEIDFMLTGFFDDIDSIRNRIVPEVLNDSGSLTDNLEIKLLPEWNNPNTFIKNNPEQTERLGNTGWFEENFNGLPNNFAVDAVTLTDLGGSSVSALSYGAETKLKATISGFNQLSQGYGAQAIVAFNSNPANNTGMVFTISTPTGDFTLNKTFKLTPTPGDVNHIQIGASLPDTIQNLLTNLQTNNFNGSWAFSADSINLYITFQASGDYSEEVTTFPDANFTLNGAAAGNKFMFGFAWIPSEESQYKIKDTAHHKNLKINSPKLGAGFTLGLYPFTYPGFSDDTAVMDAKDVKFTNNGGKLDFEITFKPNSDFAQFFQNRDGDREYAIWLSVADPASAENLSNRVSLILATGQMDYQIPVEGSLINTNISFIEHPEAETVAGVPIYNGFLEDDILSRLLFPIPVGQRIKQIIMGYEVQNVTTLETYELERFSVNTDVFITDVNGIQQINFTDTRNYKYVNGFNKNFVKIVRDPASDNNGTAAYVLLFGQKIRWEDWLQRSNVPAEFYNALLQHYGFNNNWLNYQDADQNHKINFFVIFDIEISGQVHRFKNQYFIEFSGYDTNTEEITTEHHYFNDDTDESLDIGNDPVTGRPLGVLINTANTRVEITYTKVNGDFEAGTFYAKTMIEIDGGAGAPEHRQLSSIILSEGDNILIPLSGETKLKTELIAPNKLKTSCLVDKTKILPNTRYKISGRLGCFINSDGVAVPTQIYENKYQLKYQ